MHFHKWGRFILFQEPMSKESLSNFPRNNRNSLTAAWFLIPINSPCHFVCLKPVIVSELLLGWSISLQPIKCTGQVSCLGHCSLPSLYSSWDCMKACAEASLHASHGHRVRKGSRSQRDAAMSRSVCLPLSHMLILQTGMWGIYCQAPGVVDVLIKMPLPQPLITTIPPVLQPIATMPVLTQTVTSLTAR